MTAAAVLARCRTWLAIGLLALALPASAGGASAFFGQDIGGEGYGSEFRMTDHNGRARTLADFRGQAVAIFFGYTHCPDFCPTTLAKMASVMKKLGPDAARLQVLFVTVDPKRDTEALLRAYVPAFHPSFLGLRGTPEQTRRIAQSFRVSYQIMQYRGETLVDHTASGYLIDPQGRTRLLLPYTLTADQIAADVRAILNNG